MADSNPTVYLTQPGYGEVTAGASRGFWRATRLPDSQVYRQYAEGSLLAANFNNLWCGALNLQASGRRVDHFAMIHADVEPQDWWLDTLIEEMEAKDLDMLGVVVPIKDSKGVTSIALDRPDGDTWRPLCRLTMSEVYRLPETFTSDDVGHPILLNTGLWVIRFDPAYVKKLHFTINDRIVQAPDGQFLAQCEPEDWYFSRLCHELGLRIGATRKVTLNHRGAWSFSNAQIWGQPFDSAWTEASVVPNDLPDFRFPLDVDGWLSYEEGRALAQLAKGKRVLEVGSYCGRSTICLAQSARYVVSVDPHDGRSTPKPRDTLEEFEANLSRYGVADRVRPVVGTIDAAPPGPFDLVFVDGAHDYESVACDVAAARELLAPNGLIAFHDYREPSHPDVSTVVDELICSGGELVSLAGTVAVVRPPSQTPVSLEV